MDHFYLVPTNEYKRAGTRVAIHFCTCKTTVTMNDIKIFAAYYKSTCKLMTLKALFIHSIRPLLNTKDEYKSCTLTIKI